MPGLLRSSQATGSDGDILLARLATRQRQGGFPLRMRARLYEFLSRTRRIAHIPRTVFFTYTIAFTLLHAL